MERILTQGRRFIDEYGRERVFHGLNYICGKNKNPGHPHFNGLFADLDDAFFIRAQTLGFNVLRLGLCWEDLEPVPGQYREDWLRATDAIFDRAAAHNIYVFLDMHQDLWSSFGSNNGDGAPLWATQTDGYRSKPAKRVWAEGYFWGRAVHRAFDHFWNNDPAAGKGLQEHFAALWQMLARRYANHPAFFGFDLFNEAHPGGRAGKVFFTLVGKFARMALASPDIHRIRFLRALANKNTRPRAALDVVTGEVISKVAAAGEGLIRKFDQRRYMPFLNRMTAALRETTDKGVVLMEHCYYSNLGIPSAITVPTVNGRRETNAAYSPHAYDFVVDTPSYQYASNARVGAMFEEMRRAQLRMEIPVLVGEWGGGGEGESWFPHISFLMELFERFGWSNAYYAYGDGLFDQPLMRVLSWPYPAAVNGTVTYCRTRREEGRFTLEFEQPERANPALLTEIYLSAKPKAIQTDLEIVEQPDGPGKLLLRGAVGKHSVKISY
jgi:endoglycosylceramidase